MRPDAPRAADAVSEVVSQAEAYAAAWCSAGPEERNTKVAKRATAMTLPLPYLSATLTTKR